MTHHRSWNQCSICSLRDPPHSYHLCLSVCSLPRLWCTLGFGCVCRHHRCYYNLQSRSIHPILRHLHIRKPSLPICHRKRMWLLTGRARIRHSKTVNSSQFVTCQFKTCNHWYLNFSCTMRSSYHMVRVPMLHSRRQKDRWHQKVFPLAISGQSAWCQESR